MFWLSGKDKGSEISRGEQYAQFEKTTGRKPKGVREEAQLRPELDYLWSLFMMLNNSSGGDIKLTDVIAYTEIYGDLTPFEVDVITGLVEVKRNAK